MSKDEENAYVDEEDSNDSESGQSSKNENDIRNIVITLFGTTVNENKWITSEIIDFHKPSYDIEVLSTFSAKDFYVIYFTYIT